MVLASDSSPMVTSARVVATPAAVAPVRWRPAVNVAAVFLDQLSSCLDEASAHGGHAWLPAKNGAYLSPEKCSSAALTTRCAAFLYRSMYVAEQWELTHLRSMIAAAAFWPTARVTNLLIASSRCAFHASSSSRAFSHVTASPSAPPWRPRVPRRPLAARVRGELAWPGRLPDRPVGMLYLRSRPR